MGSEMCIRDRLQFESSINLLVLVFYFIVGRDYVGKDFLRVNRVRGAHMG